MSVCDLCAQAAVAIEFKKDRISELSRGRIRGAYDAFPDCSIIVRKVEFVSKC
jgi:hypothetical protein